MPRVPTGMIRINLFVQPQVVQLFKALAKRRGTTYSQLMREALRNFAINQAKTEEPIDVGESGRGGEVATGSVGSEIGSEGSVRAVEGADSNG